MTKPVNVELGSSRSKVKTLHGFPLFTLHEVAGKTLIPGLNDGSPVVSASMTMLNDP